MIKNLKANTNHCHGTLQRCYEKDGEKNEYLFPVPFINSFGNIRFKLNTTDNDLRKV